MSRALLLLIFLFAAFQPGNAFALDPARTLAQLKHRSWTIEDGAPTGIRPITQASDGYLLLGGSDGVYRFDGVTFELLLRPGKTQRNNEVVSFVVRESGDVWVNYDSGPIGVYRDGVLYDLAGVTPAGMALEAGEDVSGGVWLGLSSGASGLAHYVNGAWKITGDESGLNAEDIYDIVPSKDGVLWVLTAHTLQYLRAGDAQFQSTGEFFPRGAALTQDAAGNIWISDNYRGTRRLPDYLHGAAAPRRPTGALPVVEKAIRQIIVDRDGAIWGATQARGIFRIPKPNANGEATAIVDEQVFGVKQGLSSDAARTVFEDREGNIWVGTTMGLDQFTAPAIVREPAIPEQSYFGYSLFSSADGSVYATDTTSLYAITADNTPRKMMSGLDRPNGMCLGGDGSLYVMLAEDVVRVSGETVAHIARPPVPATMLGCAEGADDSIWFAGGTLGVFRLDKAGWTNFPLPEDRRDEWVIAIQPTSEGVIAYFNTKGLFRVDTDPWQQVVDEQTLGIGQVTTLYASQNGFMAGGRYGLARIRGGKVERIVVQDHPLLERVQGIVQTAAGDTWVLCAKGLARISTTSLDAALTKPGSPLEIRWFDTRDGLPGPLPTLEGNILAAGASGRIWLATTESVVWIDPAHSARNTVPPPVIIANLSANGRRYANPRDLRLDEGTTNLEIDYTALSLSLPERVQFRYRLEGVDRDWVGAGARRSAFYTKLGPGNYRFHVMAANNDGVWNETGATLTFVVPPTFFQSPFFIGLCFVAAALALWVLYAMRVRQVSVQMQRRLDERLGERERIARELHDTLLQGFQGLVLRFQAATQSIPAEHAARRMMESVLDQADGVIIEGRDRVRDLRSTRTSGDIAEALSEAAARLAPDSIRTVLSEQGAVKELAPAIYDEVLRIGEEAIANAARHSGASRIDIELTYEPRRLRLNVRDNGIGIDAATVESGRSGHFGLIGMRERAEKIHAEFAILSSPSAGAKIILVVPGRIAYKGGGASIWSRVFKRPTDAGGAS